jgi:hypothetical protein
VRSLASTGHPNISIYVQVEIRSVEPSSRLEQLAAFPLPKLHVPLLQSASQRHARILSLLLSSSLLGFHRLGQTPRNLFVVLGFVLAPSLWTPSSRAASWHWQRGDILTQVVATGR